MQTEETRSWKEKIDPAFDELIKVYLDFIKNTSICTIDKKKRYLTLDGFRSRMRTASLSIGSRAIPF